MLTSPLVTYRRSTGFALLVVIVSKAIDCQTSRVKCNMVAWQREA